MGVEAREGRRGRGAAPNDWIGGRGGGAGDWCWEMFA